MYPTAILSRLLLFFIADVISKVVGLPSSLKSAGHFAVGEYTVELSRRIKLSIMKKQYTREKRRGKENHNDHVDEKEKRLFMHSNNARLNIFSESVFLSHIVNMNVVFALNVVEFIRS